MLLLSKEEHGPPYDVLPPGEAYELYTEFPKVSGNEKALEENSVVGLGEMAGYYSVHFIGPVGEPGRLDRSHL